jgi:S-adenosylmethionine:tRNA ribosyltransferase-isomerase
MVGGSGLDPGRRLALEGDVQAQVVEKLEGPRRVVQFNRPISPLLTDLGEMPLPPYIHEPLQDPAEYQTVFGTQEGSVAAPTAGLHFTPRLLQRLRDRGVGLARVTLHISLDTFAPVKESDPSNHRIHREWSELPPETAARLNQTRAQGGRILAVGTTVTRTLETGARAARAGECVGSFAGETDLYILPGFEFEAIDAMVTNFHLPRSTLVMMVSAFIGRERLLELYELAKREGYRFYSFGDAMLIL